MTKLSIANEIKIVFKKSYNIFLGRHEQKNENNNIHISITSKDNIWNMIALQSIEESEKEASKRAKLNTDNLLEKTFKFSTKLNTSQINTIAIESITKLNSDLELRDAG